MDQAMQILFRAHNLRALRIIPLNGKIKRLDPITRKVMTIAGTGHAGYKDGPALSAQLSEPAGLVDVGDGRLLVADTNNSTIRYIVLNGKDSEVRTVDLIGVANNI